MNGGYILIIERNSLAQYRAKQEKLLWNAIKPVKRIFVWVIVWVSKAIRDSHLKIIIVDSHFVTFESCFPQKKKLVNCSSEAGRIVPDDVAGLVRNEGYIQFSNISKIHLVHQ